MAHDHIFIDAYGNSSSKEVMRQGWAAYFMWFPDYLIEIDDVFVPSDTIVILGYAGGTYRGKTTIDNAHHWRVPAAWRVMVENEKIKIWQVYADSKIPFNIMSNEETEAP